MASVILFRFDTGHHAVVVLLVLEATLVLPIQAGATVEVVKARCQNISSKRASHLAHLIHLSPDLYSKYDCARMTTVGQPTASRLLFGPILLKSLHPRRVRNTCNPAADVFQAVPRRALVIENCSRHMMLRNTWVEFKFRSIHHEILLRFVKVLCWLDLNQPCVHSLSNSMCQGPVCSSSMKFS